MADIYVYMARIQKDRQTHISILNILVLVIGFKKSRIKKWERVTRQTALKILGRLERWLRTCFSLLSIAVAKHQPEPTGEENVYFSLHFLVYH